MPSLSDHEVADEACRTPGRDAESVVDYQHLARARGSGADADGRDPDRARERRAEIAGNALDDQQRCSRGAQCAAVGEQRFRRVARLALHAIASEHVDRLRLQSHVAAHRDPASDEELDGRREPRAAFELDHRRAGLERGGRRGVRGLDAGLIASERQIGDDERARARRGDAARVIEHVVEAHRQRRCVTLHDHAERIADEQHVDAGAIGGGGERRVVGGQHRDLPSVRRHPGERGNGDRGFLRARTARRVMCGRSSDDPFVHRATRARAVPRPLEARSPATRRSRCEIEEFAWAAHRGDAREQQRNMVAIVDEVEPLAVHDQQRRRVVSVEVAAVRVGEAARGSSPRSCARSRRRAGARARPACRRAPADR